MNKFYLLVSAAAVVFVLVFAINYFFNLDGHPVLITIVTLIAFGAVYFGIRRSFTK